MMASSALTPGLASSRTGMHMANFDLYSAFSKEYSVPDLSTRFGSLTHEWSMLSAKDTPRTSATPGLSFLSNHQIYKRVLEWFEVWRPWQQRMLLCGITNRCSTNQLESLATALEPIFHRDFVTTLKHRYPSASFQFKARQRLRPIKPKVKLKRKSSKTGKQKESKSGTVSVRNQTRNIIGCNSRTVIDHVQSNTALRPSAGSVRRVPDIPTSASCAGIRREQAAITLRAVTKDSGFLRKKDQTDIEVLPLQPADDIQEPIVSLHDLASKIVDSAMTQSFEQIRLDQSLGQVVYVTDAVDNVTVVGKMDSESTSTTLASSAVLKPKPSYTTLPSKSSSKRVRIFIQDQAPLVAKSLPVQGADMLKFEQVNKGDMSTINPTQHHNAWASHSIPDDVTADENLIVKENYKTHRHRSAVKSLDALHTADFFNIDRFNVFASYRADAPFAHLRRPDLIEDVNIPVQKFYKSTKWFPQTPRADTVYVKPDSAHLKTHYREQIEQVWEWMEGWQDFERLHLLKRIIKLCNADLINYLAQCLFTRLHDRCGLNWLPDKLLLLIFSYMAFDDIDSCAQVCRRWKYLTSVDELWMLKCHEHGTQHGFKDMTREIADKSARDEQEVDWKLAYFEVQEITLQAKLALPVPDTLTFQDESVTSDFHSVSTLSDAASTLSKYPRGMAARLAHESDKLKKAHRDKQKYVAELEQQETTRLRELMKSVAQSTIDDASVRGGRDTALTADDTDVDDGGVAVVHEQEVSLPPPKDLAEWVRRMAKLGDEHTVSLDVRHQLTPATDVIPRKVSSEELFRRAQLEMKKKEGKGTLFTHTVCRVRRFYGHMDSVLALGLSRRRLVTSSKDRTIRIFDNRTGETVHKLCAHKGAVTCMAFDNEVLYTGSWDKTVMVWNLVHFERIAVLHGHRGSVTCMAHDHNDVLSGSHDGTVRVWSKYTLMCHKVLTPHKLHIHTMVYECPLVYTASSDRTIVVTNVRTEETVLTFTGHPEPFLHITIERNLLISSNPKGHLWFWNKDTGRAEAAVQAHEAPITCVQFSNGHVFTASTDMMIKEWDLSTMTCLRSFVGHKGPINTIEVTASRLVSADCTGQVRVWDFTLPLSKRSSDGELALDHSVVEEHELLNPKPPPTPRTKSKRKNKNKQRAKQSEEK